MAFWGVFAISVTALGMARCRDRLNFYLFAALLGNWLIVFLAGFGEPRPSYPILPIHFLIGLSAIFPHRLNVLEAPVPVEDVAISPGRWAKWGLVIALIATSLHAELGRRYMNRPVPERGVIVDAGTVIPPDVPMLSYQQQLAGIPVGSRVCLKLLLTPQMLPPKYVSALPGIPEEATDPRGPQFFYAHPVGVGQVQGNVGITYLGARVNRLPREGDVAIVEGTVVDASHSLYASLWIAAEKVVVVQIAP